MGVLWCRARLRHPADCVSGPVPLAAAGVGVARDAAPAWVGYPAACTGAFLLLACLAATLFSAESLRLPALADSKPLLMLLGVGGTATLGQLLLTRAFTSGPPAKISVIGLTQIVFAMGLEIVVDGRSFNTATLLGMALVIAPSAWLMLHRREARADVDPLPFAGYPGDVP